MLLPLMALKGRKTSRHMRAGQTLVLKQVFKQALSLALQWLLKHGPTARTVSS